MNAISVGAVSIRPGPPSTGLPGEPGSGPAGLGGPAGRLAAGDDAPHRRLTGDAGDCLDEAWQVFLRQDIAHVEDTGDAPVVGGGSDGRELRGVVGAGNGADAIGVEAIRGDHSRRETAMTARDSRRRARTRRSK
jgi:hypothetical protein